MDKIWIWTQALKYCEWANTRLISVASSVMTQSNPHSKLTDNQRLTVQYFLKLKFVNTNYSI